MRPPAIIRMRPDTAPKYVSPYSPLLKAIEPAPPRCGFGWWLGALILGAISAAGMGFILFMAFGFGSH